jgi:uncharacterized protein YlzI (FlbEa/FlbD family)
MIHLTRLNGQPLIINSDLIKMIESTPDTVISLTNGEKIMVRESGEQILQRVVEFRRRVLDGLDINFSSGFAHKENLREQEPIKVPNEGP